MEWSSGMDWGTSYPSALEDIMQVDAYQNRLNFQASKTSSLQHEKPFMADRQMKTRRTTKDTAPHEKPLLLAQPAPPALPPQHYARSSGLIIDTQPPECVRTRTATENRTFGCTVSLCDNADDVVAVEVSLLYAGNYEGCDAVPAATILGGTKRVPVASKGEVIFDQLSLNEASTKHGEREFCLEFHLVHGDGTKTNTNCRTNGFYAFTHKKVLARRRNLTLRALGKDSGPLTGGTEMVVVGVPFVKGPSLAVAITTPHGTMNLRYADGGLELFSDSVLFFRLPPYPRRMGEVLPTSDVQAVITVTNDGRSHSNRLPFIYKAAPKPQPDNFNQLPMSQPQQGHQSSLQAPHQVQQMMAGNSWRDSSWGNATSFTEQMFS